MWLAWFDVLGVVEGVYDGKLDEKDFFDLLVRACLFVVLIPWSSLLLMPATLGLLLSRI